MKKDPILEIANLLCSFGKTINGSKSISKAINTLNGDNKYSGGRGTFNAIGSAYKKAHDAGNPNAWKILDAFRGKNGDHLWKKR